MFSLFSTPGVNFLSKNIRCIVSCIACVHRSTIGVMAIEVGCTFRTGDRLTDINDLVDPSIMLLQIAPLGDENVFRRFFFTSVAHFVMTLSDRFSGVVKLSLWKSENKVVGELGWKIRKYLKLLNYFLYSGFVFHTLRVVDKFQGLDSFRHVFHVRTYTG